MNLQQTEEKRRQTARDGTYSRKSHFCVVVNQWCRGRAETGRPDDCLNCGRCEGVGD